MPSASTARPIDGSLPILSSLWARTMPVWVAEAISRARARSLMRARSQAHVHGAVCPGARAQRLRHLLAGGVALFLLLGERPVDGRDQALGQRRVQRQWIDGRLIGDLVHQLGHRIALERQRTAAQLIERRPEREQVGLAVDLAARELLRR